MTFLLITLVFINLPWNNNLIPTRQNVMLDSSNVRSIGRWTYDGALAVFLVSDTIEYITSGAGLYIIDISNPSQPQKIREMLTYDIILNYSQDSCFLLTAMDKGGAVLYDISDPTNPILISQYLTPDAALGVHLVNHTAYIAAFTAGLRIVDYSNPYVPVEIGSFQSGEMDAFDVKVIGNYAYLANGIRGFRIIDVTNPTSPKQVGAYIPTQLRRARDICIYNDTIVLVTWGDVAGAWLGVTLFNVANPTQPQILSSIPAVYPHEVEIKNGIAYIAAYKIKIVNISNPSSPILLTELNMRARNLTLHSNLLCVSVEDSIFPYRSKQYYIDISNPANPVILGVYASFPAFVKGISAKNNYCYLASWGDGMKVFDISNVQNPMLVAETDSAIHERIFIYDTLAFLPTNASYGGGYGYILKIFSIANPTAPRELGRLAGTEISGYSIFVKDSLAFLSTGSDLKIINVVNPANPQIITQIYNPSSFTWNSYVDGNALYIAEGLAGLRIVDITDPTNPVDLGRFQDTGWTISDVNVRFPYAYVADGWLRILDIRDPTNIIELSHLPSRYASWELCLNQNFVYLTDGWCGIRIVDIRVPENPIEVGFYITPGSAEDVYVTHNQIYVADFRGFLILEQYSPGITETEPQTRKLLQRFTLKITPQPTKNLFIIEYQITKESTITLDVLNSLGKIKKTIKKQVESAGNYQLNLDVSDLPAGIYFIRLKQGREQIVKKITIVR